MSDAEQLDEALRGKLREAAEAELQRGAANVPAIQAALERESRALKMKMRHVVAGLACAAAVLLALWADGSSREQQQARSTTVAAARCALPTALAITHGEDGGPQLSLGRFGELAASPGSIVRVESSDPCLLSLQLSRGTLAGDLNSLKPAALRVRTAHGSVIVRGTRFSIRADDALEVVLLTGRVDIEDGRSEQLEPAHVFHKQGKTRRVTAVRPVDADGIARLLSKPARGNQVQAEPAPEVVEPSTASAERGKPSAGELLSRAEAERKRGRLPEARALYRAASALGGDDAEVALLRWVRLELDAHGYDNARLLLQRHTRAFATGKLRAESAWLGIVLLNARGEYEDARRAARAFLARFPEAPQADAARALVAAREPAREQNIERP
jgi:tetratricopeptide (TPR) repeat protein